MDIQRLINDYSNWLKTEITVAKFGEFYELTTPYFDRFNDYLQIYVKQEEDGIISMTDDGYIIGNLISSGISLKAGSKRKVMLDSILSNYSLRLDGEQITTSATSDNFPQKKHLMVQAMLSIDDMFSLSGENIKNFFVEDVQTFFDSNEIFYSRDFSLIGKTGSLYTYDFHFQRTKNLPERFCKTINNVRESGRNLTIFNWIDTKEKRSNEGKLIVFLNDENKISSSDIDAFKTYEIEPVIFSKREQSLTLFNVS